MKCIYRVVSLMVSERSIPNHAGPTQNLRIATLSRAPGPYCPVEPLHIVSSRASHGQGMPCQRNSCSAALFPPLSSLCVFYHSTASGPLSRDFGGRLRFTWVPSSTTKINLE